MSAFFTFILMCSVVIVGVMVFGFVVGLLRAPGQLEKMESMSLPELNALLASAEQHEIRAASLDHGQPNSAMFCPHCGHQGKVHTKVVSKKKGISGGKATGAILTGGMSMLATGLSRKEDETEAYCRNCRNQWSL